MSPSDISLTLPFHQTLLFQSKFRLTCQLKSNAFLDTAEGAEQRIKSMHGERKVYVKSLQVSILSRIN